MPLYEFRTDDGESIEMMFPMDDCPSEIASSTGRVAHKVVIAAATPAKWGDSGEKPYWDHGLGCRVNGFKDAQRIAQSRGLRSLLEYGSPSEGDRALQSAEDKRARLHAAREAESKEYDTNLVKFGGDQGRAIVETWSAQRILKGETVFAKGNTEKV